MTRANGPELPLGWADPELRKIWAEDAVAERDAGKLLEGFRYFMKTHRSRADGTVAEYARVLRDLLTYLWYDLGRSGLEVGSNDLASWYEDLRRNGVHYQAAGHPRKPLSEGSLRRYAAGIREAGEFLRWAGLPFPTGLRMPAPPKERRLRVIGNGEWNALLAEAERLESPGRELELALLYLLGEEGMTLRQLSWSRVNDYRGNGHFQPRIAAHLTRAAITLDPTSAAALESWLDARENVLGVGVPGNTFVSPTRGVPLNETALRMRLRERARSAGVRSEDLARGLRNRAAVRLYERFGDRNEVARHMGLALQPDVLRQRNQQIDGGM